MLLMLLIGWIVLLPALVVVGLYVGSSVLGRRRSALSVYADLFADDQAFEPEATPVTPEAITGPLVSGPGRWAHAAPNEPASAAPPVGAGY